MPENTLCYVPTCQRLSDLEREVERRTAELVQANLKLKESEEGYRRIIESTSEGIWTVDENLITKYANRQLCKMLGYAAEEMMGAHLDTFVSESERAHRDERLAELRQKGSDHFEFTFLKKDGTPLFTSLRTNLIHDGQGRYAGAMAIVTDISERKKIEERMALSQKLEVVGQLAGGVAHDFNNLLTVILMQADLLLESEAAADHDHIFHGIREIRDTAEHAAAITRQLLLFSRMKNREVKHINLNGIVTDICRLVKRLAGDDIQLTNALDEELPDIEADSAQIQQVIVNLAVNARDAMPNGGRLDIHTRSVSIDAAAAAASGISPGEYACLSVTDSGTGMSAETRARIFEPFFTTKGAGKGTGLGLATVFGIVKQNDGHISVYSELGKGTCFKVYFPRSEHTAATQVEPAEASLAKGSARLLLVEDENTLRNMMREALEKSGYCVSTACNGEEAISLYGEKIRNFDLILTDVIMPQLGGPELIQKIAEQNPGFTPKVLYISGFPEGKLKRAGLASESTKFLEKPYSMKVFLRKVMESLAEPPPHGSDNRRTECA